MSKNEIHARISLQLMEALKRICSERNCNLSDVTRAALVLYVDVWKCPNLLEHHNLLKSQNSLEVGLLGTTRETTRATPDLLDELISNNIEQKKNSPVIQLIEQELEISFGQCRDEYDPEDGQLYWFWSDSKDETFLQFDPDSLNNQCPVKRFNSQEDAIRDCLKEKLTNPAEGLPLLTESGLPSLNTTNESSEDNIIDW